MKYYPHFIGLLCLTFVSLAAHRQLFARSGNGASIDSSAPSKAIIITEILADPSPPVALPEMEFIELFNRSSQAIDLQGWEVLDPSGGTRLDTFILEPHAYVVLTSTALSFNIPNAITVPGLPTLNNSGDSLVLRDAQGMTIDVVVYSSSWYRNTSRKDGGWSLEIIDPENVCETTGNWIVSDDPSGGTPGRQNSVYASNPDLTPPHMLSLFLPDDKTIHIEFDEALNENLSAMNVSLVPSLPAVEMRFSDAAMDVIVLHLSEPFDPGVRYSVIAAGITDCAGNVSAHPQRLSFALPQEAGAGDAIINEILFNPGPGGTDFIEIMNVSGKFVDLSGWSVGVGSEEGKWNAMTIDKPFILGPNQFAAITADAAVLAAHYAVVDSTVIENKLPPFPDNYALVGIFNSKDSLLDAIQYSEQHHNVFIRNAEGVSLERISPLRAGTDPSNWTSASATVGYATPGRENSATRSPSSGGHSGVDIIPSAFIPIDGTPNYAEIRYHFEKPGQVATLIVYNDRGEPVKQLANNVVLGIGGVFRWEGDRDDGYRAPVGYYVILFEIFAETGLAELYRVPVAIVTRW